VYEDEGPQWVLYKVSILAATAASSTVATGVQAMDPDMFLNYQGYADQYVDVLQRFDDGRQIVKTPNVVKTVQEFFNCSRMLGAELEDDGGSGSRGSHWEQRIFEVRILFPGTLLVRH
jgi:hypothetical protein